MANPNGIDGITTVTAAMVAYSGEVISGQTIDAVGADVAIFIPYDVTDVTIEDNTIYGATMAGIYADGGAQGGTSASDISITGNTIYQIGDHTNGEFTPDGVQYGVGILLANNVTGSITDNTIYEYQKGGIVAFDFTGPVSGNTVTGLGNVNFIAQNGIQLGYPQNTYYFPSSYYKNIFGNTVTDNIYVGGRWVSTGVMIFASSGVSSGQIMSYVHVNNEVNHNQANVYVYVES